MIKMGKRLLILMMCCLVSYITHAQSSIASNGAVNDTMRSNNKIYVVMAVCVTILIGLLLYVIRIDRKITGIEKSSVKSI